MTDELPDVARYVDALASPIRLEEITGPARRPRRGPRRAVAFVLAAALVAIISAVVVTALSSRVSEPARTHPTAVRPAPAPTTTTTPSRTSTSTANAVITSVPLPGRFWADDITTTNRGVLLTGLVATDSAHSTCDAARVDPRTMQLVDPAQGNCDYPALSGETVRPVNAPTPSNATKCCTETLSIARRDPRTGTVTIGPVAMTYGSYSDTRPITAYGGDWLWIYAVESIPNGPEVLQISRSTGAVVNTVKTPQLYRPLLAADDDGLWLANSVRGGQCQGCGPPPALTFVAPGAHTAARVAAVDARAVLWLLATGHHVWAGVGPDYTKQTIVKFGGSNLRPVFQVADRGFDPFEVVVGGETGGLWAVIAKSSKPTANNGYDYNVVRIDPDTGRESLIAALPRFELPPNTGVTTTPPAAFFDGSLFVLEPPYRANGFQGYSTLVRVTPRG